MSILLKKGQKADLTKTNPGLNTIIVGLGWDTKTYSGDYDIDTAAFVLNSTGKTDSDNEFVFYNNSNWGNGAIIHSGDKKISSSDDEQIKIELKLIPENVSRIAFTCTIYDYEKKNQNFGQVKNAYIRIVNGDTGKEMVRFDLGEKLISETAVVFGEIYRHNGEWKFNPIGSGYKGGLNALCRDYGVTVDEDVVGSNSNHIKTSNEKLTEDMSRKADILNNSRNQNNEKKVNLSKIELKKKGDKINLSKSNDNKIGKVIINLNWSKGQKKIGLFGNFLGGNEVIDLDLGCLYELKDGSKGVVQALGNCFGSFENKPYIKLLDDDRTGESKDGEFLWMNGNKMGEIKRIMIYAFIYEGVSNWSQADGLITVKQSNGPEIIVKLDEPRNGLGMCAAISIENINNELRIQKIEQYFSGHSELDNNFGWGLRWKQGSK